MATTYDQVQDAFNQKEAARQALEAAQQEQQAINSDPERFAREGPGAQAKVHAAETAYNHANSDYRFISAAYAKENPPTPNKPPTASQQATAATEAEKDKNQAQTGIRETDVQRAARERTEAPKAARQDSPAQTSNARTAVVNANTRIQQTANTAVHQQNQDNMAVVNAQKDALYKAGLLYQNTRNQVSQEAQADVAAKQKNMTEAGSAAKTLLENATNIRRQNIDYTKTRADFVGNVLNTAMPKVVELMLKTPKGSKVAGNFLRAYIVMANEAYKNAGLENTPPPVDTQSPHFQTLLKLEGFLPDKIPEMPTSDQISWRTAKAIAPYAPPNGWNGPTDIRAWQLPDMPPGTNGNGIDPVQEAGQSPEGKALYDKITQTLQGVPTDPAQQTPEQKAQVEAAKQAYQAGLKDIAQKKTAAPRPSGPVQESQDLKTQLRSALVSGDPNQRLRIMSTVMAGASARASGQPLTDDQNAALNNLDPEDIALIQQHMTPEVGQILLNFKNGKKPTPAEIATVQEAVTNVSAAVKNRTTAPNQGTIYDGNGGIDPNVVQAQQAAHQAKQQEDARLRQENPELAAMMDQVREEQRQEDAQARQNGAIVDRFGSDTDDVIKQIAQDRLDSGQKPDPTYMTMPHIPTKSQQPMGNEFVPMPNFNDNQQPQEGSPFQTMPDRKLGIPDLSNLFSGNTPKTSNYEPVKDPLSFYNQNDDEEDDTSPRPLFQPAFNFGGYS